MKASPVRRQVVLGLLGPTLDAGRGPRRWEKWRPTVALCDQPDLAVDRLDLIFQPSFNNLCNTVVADVRQVSPETEVRLHQVEYADPWDFEQVFAGLLDFARAYRFDPEAEDYLLHITTGTHVAQICLFLLAEARHIPARLLQTSPGGKPQYPGTHRIIDLDLSKYDRLATRFETQQIEDVSFLKRGIETRNVAFNALIDRIEQVVTRSAAPVLLSGPTGAGKTVLARRIHELKRRRRLLQGPLVEVNCATLRGDQAMSTLFGHAKGAFTGATASRPGLLREAHGGVLFLDEIGELGPDEQAMLLRAIEDKRFFPMGSDREATSDFALIAGTNRDLHAQVELGKFREDLLARIDLWSFELPGLAARREDIEPNLEFELERYAARERQRVTFNREGRETFLRFALSAEATWPANFRDFSAAILRMATLAPGGRITKAIAEEEVERLRRAWRRPQGREAASRVVDLLGSDAAAALDRFDRVQLEDVLTVCRTAHSLSEAGRRLFSESRKTRASINDSDRLRKYLAKFDLEFQDLRDAP